MIARIWHGVTAAEKADAYYQYLQQTGIRDYQDVEGNRGVYVMRRIEDDKAHFTLLTLWESEEAIRNFAGDNIEVARYYPEDADYLLEFEPNVIHHEILESHLH